MTTALEQINNFFHTILSKQSIQISQNYIPQEDTYVFVEGPRYSTLGYTNIAKGWQDFCNSALSLKNIEWVEGPYTQEYEQIAWVAGIVLVKVAVKSQLIQQKFRATFILQKNEIGNWQIQHEHLSAPLPDPYGIGDWLQEIQ